VRILSQGHGRVVALAYAILDSTLIPIDRVTEDQPDYSAGQPDYRSKVTEHDIDHVIQRCIPMPSDTLCNSRDGG
jgi:hypothetical protein